MKGLLQALQESTNDTKRVSDSVAVMGWSGGAGNAGNAGGSAGEVVSIRHANRIMFRCCIKKRREETERRRKLKEENQKKSEIVQKVRLLVLTRPLMLPPVCPSNVTLVCPSLDRVDHQRRKDQENDQEAVPASPKKLIRCRFCMSSIPRFSACFRQFRNVCPLVGSRNTHSLRCTSSSRS